MYGSWIEYWDSRAASPERDVRLVSGYCHALSRLSDETLAELVGLITTKPSLKKGDGLLDLGCGAGVLTLPLSLRSGKTVGVDGSLHMMKRLNGVHVMGEGALLPFRESCFDKVLCHSVFQYFPSHEYAAAVLREVCRVCKDGGRVYVVDLPDKEKREAYERTKPKEEHGLEINVLITKD